MDQHLSAASQAEEEIHKLAQETALNAVLEHCGGRREFLAGVVGIVLASACKSLPQGSATLAASGATPGTGPFLTEIATTEAGLPLAPLPNIAFLPPPVGLQDPDPAVQKAWRSDPANKPWADYVDTRQARGKAVGGVIGKWLATKPYDMFTELRSDRPVFVPEVGPAIITKHPDVIQTLSNNQDFQVSGYATEMQKTMEGPLKHFILCTDDTSLYEPDSTLLRNVVVKADAEKIRSQIRGFCDTVSKAVLAGPKQFDFVPTFAITIPVQFSALYLGVPSFEVGQQCFFNTSLTGGSTFALTDNQKGRYTNITQGEIPTMAKMYEWGKFAYQNFFNNVGGDPQMQKDGLESSEKIQAYMDLLIEYWKRQLFNAKPAIQGLAKLRGDERIGIIRRNSPPRSFASP